MMTVTDPTTLKLSRGKGTPDEPCLQSKAALVHAHIHGYLTPGLVDQVFTDHPCWQNKIITQCGIAVNDLIPEDAVDLFARLDRLMPRIVAATVRSDREVEERINARLLCWLARGVLDRVVDVGTVRDLCERAINARERWLDGQATEQECQDLALQVAKIRRSRAVRAAENACALLPHFSSDAVFAAEGAASAIWAEDSEAVERLIELFEQLLDQWEKACAEEGAMVDDGWIQALKETGIAVDVNLTKEEDDDSDHSD